MSTIGKNIRKIRTVKKLSQASFAEIFNLARPSIGAYEGGRAEPKIDTVIQIANYFGLSTDALLTKELTINELYRFDSLKKENISVQKERPSGNRQNIIRGNILLVGTDKFWEYINNFKNSDFLDALPHYHFPNISAARAMAFEIADDSMSYGLSGIHKHDLLVCDKSVDKQGALEPEQVYVLITREDIVARRYIGKKDKLRFSSDHPDTPAIEYEWKDFLEVWHVSAVLSGNLHPPVKINEKINYLETRLKDVTERLVQLEKFYR